MKKFVFVLIAVLAFATLIYGTASADLVPCGQDPVRNPCQIRHIGVLIRNIFDLILKISIALAILCVTIGGGLIMISGGPGAVSPAGIASPNLHSTGKTFIKSAIVGILIIFLSWVIVNAIFTTLGGPPLPPNP